MGGKAEGAAEGNEGAVKGAGAEIPAETPIPGIVLNLLW